MKLFNRLLGGAGAAALAATAHDILDDEEQPNAASAAAAAPAAEPEDDEEDEEQPPAAAAEPAPAAAAAPAPAAAAEEPVLPANVAELADFAVDREAAGRAEMHQRITTVFASEHVAGREAAAAELLAADLPADKIVATLSKLPKGASTDAMLNALSTQPNPSLEPGGDQEEARADNYGWGKAHSKVSRRRGQKTDRK